MVLLFSFLNKQALAELQSQNFRIKCDFCVPLFIAGVEPRYKKMPLTFQGQPSLGKHFTSIRF